jgi:hypothetical protein
MKMEIELIKGHNCPEKNLKILENNIIDSLTENTLNFSKDFINGMCFVYKSEKGMMSKEEFTIVMLGSMAKMLTSPITDVQRGISYAINITRYDMEKDEGGIAELANFFPRIYCFYSC